MLNEEGFLSSELKNVESKFADEFSVLFKFVKDVNKYFQSISFEIKIKGDKIYHWCLAALYLRSLSTFQSIFLLCSKGISGEAKVLLRSFIEIEYIIIAISKNFDFANEYLAQEVIENEKILKKSFNWKENFPNSISINEIEEKLNEVIQVKDSNKCKKLSIRDYAEKADMLMDYDMYYSILCLTSHANIYEIKKHFILDTNGALSSFNWGPNKNNIPSILISSLDRMFRIVENIKNSFDLSLDKKFSDMYSELKILSKKYISI